MKTPTCGTTHDVVIYDGLANLDPIGLIVKPMTYRVAEAPNLVPRVAMGAAQGLDYEGRINWVQTNFGAGAGQTRVPMHEPLQFYEGKWVLPTRQDGHLGVSIFPQMHSIVTLEDLATTVDSAGLDHWYEYPQRRWHYLHQIRSPGYGYRDRIITFAGAIRPAYTAGDNAERQADWANYKLATVDACAYSGVAIVATQQSFAGRFQPAQILVHHHSSFTYLVGSTSAAAITTYDSKLWRAGVHQPYIAWYDIESVNDSINPSWSTPIDVGATGRIMRLTSFLGRLFVAKTDGIWAYEAGRTYPVIDYQHMMANRPLDCENYDVFLVAHGALYWNMGNRMVRYTAGGLLEELGGELDSRPIAACAVRRGIAIVTAHWLWILDVHTGGMTRVCSSAKRPLHLVGSERGNLHVAPYRSTYMAGLGHEAVFWAEPYAAHAGEPRLRSWDTDVSWIGATKNQVYVKTGYTDLGYPALLKTWHRVLVHFQGILNSSWPSMSVYYRTAVEQALPEANPAADPTTGFTFLGSVVSTPTVPGVASFEFAATAESQALQVLVTLETANSLVATDARPVIYALEAEGTPTRTLGKHTRRLQTRFNAIITDDMELLSGEVENSASYITTAIYSFAGTGATHIVALPYPPPVGHTVQARVELGATGAVVPVLPSSYSGIPSGCPGAEVSIVITEL